MIRYRNWTTGDLFESLRLPLEVRSILAGQSGDLLLPPSQASLLVQSGLVCGYDSGPCVPAESYEHLFATLVEYINRCPGCQVFLKTWVKSLEIKALRVTAARSAKGVTFEADRFIFNGDPKSLTRLVSATLPRRFLEKLDYEYSPSCFTLYLGIRGLDLERHGFGNWNVWHYAHDDIDRCYHDQLTLDRLENPSLFLSTPTLHHKRAKIAPDGCHQLVICTPCRYEHFKDLQRKSRLAYLAEKERVTHHILDQLEKHYLPGLRGHLDHVVAGSPTTNERFVFAPRGNAYGANLTPRNFHVGKIDYRTPWPNLWLVGASAGVPSFAGGIHFATLLYEKLTGDCLRSTRYCVGREEEHLERAGKPSPLSHQRGGVRPDSGERCCDPTGLPHFMQGCIPDHSNGCTGTSPHWVGDCGLRRRSGCAFSTRQGGQKCSPV